MKSVTPYRNKFFQSLNDYCDLTVVYERDKSSNRDDTWATSKDTKFKSIILGGMHYRKENSISLKIIKVLNAEYDAIIFGCYNNPTQIIGKFYLQLKKRKFYFSLDGEIDARTGVNAFVKKILLSGAQGYFCAGERSSESMGLLMKKNAVPYYFSSLSENEITQNSVKSSNRGNFILVIGQYLPYKGLDIALRVAKMMPDLEFVFVGMGRETADFLKDAEENEINNIKAYDFLGKEDLEKMYLNCKLLLLPSRRECWGLVINEAASYGTPIIATQGSGAAVEFLSDEYSEFLVEPNDAEGIADAIGRFMLKDSEFIDNYSLYLKNKSSQYYIERSAEIIGGCV